MGAAGEEWQFVEAAKCVDTESAAQVTIGTKLPTIRPELEKCCATLAATLAHGSRGVHCKGEQPLPLSRVDSGDYSGSTKLPFIWNVPTMVAAPVPGWPPPTETE
jgi:hypothetical protein